MRGWSARACGVALLVLASSAGAAVDRAQATRDLIAYVKQLYLSRRIDETDLSRMVSRRKLSNPIAGTVDAGLKRHQKTLADYLALSDLDRDAVSESVRTLLKEARAQAKEKGSAKKTT